MARRNVWTLALALVIAVSSSSLFVVPAVAGQQTPSVQAVQDANLGTILAGPNGMTVYRYTKDSPGVSNCYDKCAVNWPPLLLSAGEQPLAPAGLNGTMGTTTRKDGAVQVTYNGWPLYYWARDQKPGDTTGQNVGQVWFVLNPDAPTVKLAQDPTLGAILTGPTGMTLYVFTKDVPGTTNCYAQCAVNWPPLILQAGALLNAPPGLAGKLDTTVRKDGSLQVTLNGAPLYYWLKDKAPGETTGHKVGGVWFASVPGIWLDTAGNWAQGQVSAAVRGGWIKGNPDGSFKPNGEMTRAEFVTALTLAFKTPSQAGPASFTDTASHQAAAAIQAALAAGIVQAADYPAGQFEPDRVITREEAIVMLVRAVGLGGTPTDQEKTLDRFSDYDDLSAKAAPLVAVAVEHSLVQGYPDGTIRGGKTVSRGEAVALVVRALALQK